MASQTCPECSMKVPASAQTCPYCSCDIAEANRMVWGLLIGVGLPVLIVIGLVSKVMDYFETSKFEEIASAHPEFVQYVNIQDTPHLTSDGRVKMKISHTRKGGYLEYVSASCNVEMVFGGHQVSKTAIGRARPVVVGDFVAQPSSYNIDYTLKVAWPTEYQGQEIDTSEWQKSITHCNINGAVFSTPEFTQKFDISGIPSAQIERYSLKGILRNSGNETISELRFSCLALYNDEIVVDEVIVDEFAIKGFAPKDNLAPGSEFMMDAKISYDIGNGENQSCWLTEIS